MKSRILKLELDSDNMPSAEELRTKLNSVIDDNLPERARAAAREQADELVKELLSGGAVRINARSIMAALASCGEILEGLEGSVRDIAQCTANPAHIFDLGAAMGNIVSAHGHIEMAKTALQEYLECDHCKPKTEPEEPKGPLS